MNDQQIDDLIAYMTHIARDPDEVRQESLEQYGIDGEAVFEGFCARCHTEGAAYGEPGVPGGGALGPSLIAGATVRQFPTVDSHVDWVAQTVPYGQLYGTRGISEGVMPFFENMLTPEQIRAVVEYERGL